MSTTVTKLTIIADDLTGACDTGALFAGTDPVPVTVHPQRRAGGPVAVVDLESRSLPAADARRRVRDLTVGSLPQEQWFKKIDSTMRGGIAAETEELIANVPVPGAILCPAFPAQGRQVLNRILLIGGIPVANTPIGQDPDFTLGTSDLVAGLRGQAGGTVEWCSLAELRSGHLTVSGGAIVVADAESDTDLDRMVATALGFTPPPILVGSAGLAGALVRYLGLTVATSTAPPGLRWLIVAGSRHPATLAQLAAIPAGRAHIVAAPATPAASRQAVAADLARQAHQIILANPVDRVAVTGGDTAVALYRELDAERIDLKSAPLPGLALGTMCCRDGRQLDVLTKAGGFGAPDLFVRLIT